MAKKKFKLSELTDEERLELLSKRRIQVLSKYISKHYINNDKWMDTAGSELDLVIHFEIIKGLDKEFEILRDDPNDPLILDLIREKTELIINEIYSNNSTSREN